MAKNQLNKAFSGPALTAMAVLLLALFGLRFLTSGWEWAFMKKAVPLRRPLTSIPERFGAYELINSERMTPAVERTLGTREYISHLYRDTRLGPGEEGSAIRVHVVYYTGNQEPVSAAHVPEICYVASGNTTVDMRHLDLEIPFPREQATEDNVIVLKTHDGTPVRLPPNRSIPIREFEYLAPGRTDTNSVIYFFIYNGKYIASRKDITLQFMDRASRTVYYCKIEVASGSLRQGQFSNYRGEFIPDEGDVAGHRPRLASFLRWFLPEVAACLPDPDNNAAAAIVPEGVVPEVGGKRNDLKLNLNKWSNKK